MSSHKLQTLALAALAATYLEARTLVLEDLDIVRRLSTGVLRLAIDRYRNRINFFYTIESLAKSNPNDLAIVYPRQIKPISSSSEIQSSTSKELAENYFVVERYTFSQFYQIILKYAQVLKSKYGINDTHTVAIDCMNKPEFLFVWFAIWSLGATPAFINYNLTDNSLIHCIKTASAHVLFVDNDPSVTKLVEPYEEELSKITQIAYLDDQFHNLVNTAHPYRAPDSQRHPEHKHWNTACFIYTSGTTGLPKAAIMSWKKAKEGSFFFATVIKLSSSDILFTSMPLYHSTASVLGVLASFNKGAAIAIGHKFSTTTFWTQVSLSKATYIQYVGETCRYLLNNPIISPDEKTHCVKCATGNGMRPDVWEKFKTRFNIPAVAEFFASTEGPLATTNYQEGEFGVGAVGKYGMFVSWLMLNFTHALVKVDPENGNEIYRDPNTGLCKVPNANEPGELLTRIGDASKVHETFQGYHGNKKATEEKVLRNVFKKGDAYFRSGDLLKKDHQGLLYFVDRLGDTFRWKSENVSTNEVEEVIHSYEGIDQVVVVGVKVPFHEGRAGFAVISPTTKFSSSDSSFDMNHFSQFLINKLPKYAVPIFIKFVDTIHRTGNNKVQKKIYQNQKFPRSDNTNADNNNDDEQIYWLKDNKYVPLVDEDWNEIGSGKIKL